MATKFPTIPAKSLSQPIGTTDTSFRLTDIENWDGEDLVAADLGDRAWAVFRNNTRTQIEIMEFDPTTIASNDIDIIYRGLAYDGDLTDTSADRKFTWPAGTIVNIGTNAPQLFMWLKEYIDNIAIAGSPTATTAIKGLVEIATQAEVDAKTATGGTGATIVPSPALMRATKYNDYVVDTGIADTYVITPAPVITAYVAGQQFTFKVATTNTAASTLNVNGVGAKSIKKNISAALGAGDLVVGQLVTVIYDGTNFQITSVRVKGIPVKRVYTANDTWTKPSGLEYIETEVQAGGGGGGGANRGSSTSAGGGGGGGGYSRKIISATALGATETVTVGAAGAAGVGSTITSGVAGGNSSFGAHATGTGGGGGTTVQNSSGAGGAGGVGASGDLNINGSKGGEANSNTTFGAGGQGGGSFFGKGGTSPASTGAITGDPGVGYGAGGSAGSRVASGSTDGGAGVAGVVVVIEYY